MSGGVGLDCTALSLEADETVILSSNPVIGTIEELGEYGVLAAVNNIVVVGATPVGIMLTILLPEETEERELKRIVAQSEAMCAKLQIQIIGGHTEVTKAVSQPVLNVTAVGKVKKDQMVSSAGVKPGMDLILTKWIALEGTVILTKDKEEELLTRYSVPFIEKVKALKSELTIKKEALVAVETGVSAMKDGSNGGVFGALWEMAEASGVGLEIDLKKIPIRQETVEVCEFLGANPYELHAGGTILMAAEDGNALVMALESAGIQAAIIGKATDGNDRVLFNEDERRFLEPAKPDELHKFLQ